MTGSDGAMPMDADAGAVATPAELAADLGTARTDAGPWRPAEGVPDVRVATWADINDSIADGISDLKANPTMSMGVGAVYALGGIAIMYMLDAGGLRALAFPLMAGFALIAPFVAVIFYEISRRREHGQGFGTADIMPMVAHTARKQILYQGFVMLFWLAFWVHIGWMQFALFMGVRAELFWSVLGEMFTTSHGLGFLLMAHVTGAFFAATAFAMSVITFPLLLDRDLDCVTAMITSFKTVMASPKVMLGWAAIIGLGLAAASLPFFLGLIIVLPLLGHSSWHLYRRLVVE
ncbi:MAG: DUF2189 domain-containing protein [Pseudomonadota bacterium]